MKLTAWFLSVLLIATMVGCDEKKEERKCEPFTVRADPYNPGAYRVCNRDGTEEKKYQGPTPPPRTLSV